jgi:hypothetical protein
MTLIGCSITQLREHIEKQFTDGMSWDNYGKWHVDHIVPCSAFDLFDASQQQACFHFTNLQPLWAKDNRAKGGLKPAFLPNRVICYSQDRQSFIE